MQKTVIVVSIAGLAFAVVSLWALRTEPAGPLLALPQPGLLTETRESGKPGDQSDQASSAADKPEFVPPPLTDLPDDDGTSDELTAPITAERQSQVRQLIHSLRPQLSEEALTIWVDRFGSMPDADIRFMLSQSDLPARGSLVEPITSPEKLQPPAVLQLRSGGRRAATAPITQHEFTAPPGYHLHTGTPLSTAHTNLQNSTTVGYREMLDLKVVSAGERATPRRVLARSYVCGEIERTGNPLHLALLSSGPQFFLLEDGRLTRNGMFQRMPDGRLGLLADDGYVALHQSPVPEAEQPVKVHRDGRVTQGTDQRVVGTIAVVMVHDVNQLATRDGVYFSTEAATSPVRDVQLQSESLELSNVDPDRNRLMLQAAQLFN